MSGFDPEALIKLAEAFDSQQAKVTYSLYPEWGNTLRLSDGTEYQIISSAEDPLISTSHWPLESWFQEQNRLKSHAQKLLNELFNRGAFEL